MDKSSNLYFNRLCQPCKAMIPFQFLQMRITSTINYVMKRRNLENWDKISASMNFPGTMGQPMKNLGNPRKPGPLVTLNTIESHYVEARETVINASIYLSYDISNSGS